MSNSSRLCAPLAIRSLAASNYGTTVETKFEFPKRPKSAYLRFANEIQSQQPKSQTSTHVNLGEKWRSLSDEARQRYVEATRKDLEAWKEETAKIKENPKFAKEMEELAAEKNKKRDARAFRRAATEHKELLKDLEMPKKFLLPQSIYMKEKYPIFKAKNPNSPVYELFKLVVGEWKTLTEDEKSRYVDKSQSMKTEYTKAMEKWTEDLKKSGKAEILEKSKQKLNSIKQKKQ